MDRSYSSLEQRMVQSYLDTLPPFTPAADGPAPAEQERFHHLIRSLYELLWAEPQLLVSRLHEDDAHPNRATAASYGKPDLKINMRKALKAVDGLLETMRRLGQDPDSAKISRRQGAILARLGVDPAGPLPTAWTWMATRPGGTLLTFSRCLFQDGYPYAAEVYARLLGETSFRRLESSLLAQGYTRFECLDGTMSLDYANLAWDPEPPRGGSLYKIRHPGIACSYDPYFAHSARLGLAIPGGMKPFLDQFDPAEESVKDFMWEHTNRCSGCRYCVQTDKTGTRPLAAIPVEHRGETRRLCPYYPGFSYRWTALDEGLVDNLIGMLAFMEEVGAAGDS
ncbi:MAG: hypothetical protein GXX93_09110 [Anaerolineae bacterium]|nr:hypothetical protein [Anaerolineae bacterium]